MLIHELSLSELMSVYDSNARIIDTVADVDDDVADALLNYKNLLAKGLSKDVKLSGQNLQNAQEIYFVFDSIDDQVKLMKDAKKL